MRVFLAACLSVALAATTFATTVLPLSFEQLVEGSSIVAYGRVIDVRAQWTDDRRFIESVVSLEVLRGMKGGAADTLVFTVPGGQVGRYINVIPGAPVFTAGDLAVVFLTGRGARLPVTTGLTQGVYRVQRDGLVVPPAIENGRIARGDLRRKPVSLATFESNVRAASR
jgi:hypothetical protein